MSARCRHAGRPSPGGEWANHASWPSFCSMNGFPPRRDHHPVRPPTGLSRFLLEGRVVGLGVWRYMRLPFGGDGLPERTGRVGVGQGVEEFWADFLGWVGRVDGGESEGRVQPRAATDDGVDEAVLGLQVSRLAQPRIRGVRYGSVIPPGLGPVAGVVHAKHPPTPPHSAVVSRRSPSLG